MKAYSNQSTVFIVTILAVLTALLLSGCTPVVKTYVCADGSQVQDASMCRAPAAPAGDKASTTAGSTDYKNTPPAVDENAPVMKWLSDSVKPLFAKTDSIKNLKFNYFRSDDPYTQNKFTASRDYAKVELLLKDSFKKEEQFDVVYLNLKDKTAVAYCELRTAEYCPDKDKQFPVEFATYHVFTPLEWLDQVETADTTGKSKQIDGRQAREINFTTSGKSGTMWLDSFFGAPVEVNYDGVTYRFSNLLVNNAKDTDLTHQPGGPK